MLRCHRTALNTGPFEVINTKMKRNAEWKDEALNKSISQWCRVKTGLLWPPSPATMDRTVLPLVSVVTRILLVLSFNASSFHSENRRDKVMVIGFCGDSVSEQERLQGENQ